MIKDFKQFLMRGNVVDLAVAVAIGGAFTAVVNALVKDLMTPLVAAVGGRPDFSRLIFRVHGSVFMYGDFINTVISFVIMSFVVFFFVVQPVNKLVSLTNRSQKKEDDQVKDPQLVILEDIRDELKRLNRGRGAK